MMSSAAYTMVYAQCGSAKSAAQASSMTAEVMNPLRNHIFFLLTSVFPSMTLMLRHMNPHALYVIKLICFPGNRSTMDSMSSAKRMDMDSASAKCLYPSGDHASIGLICCE